MNDLISRADAIEAIRRLPNAGIRWFVNAEAVFDVLLSLPPAEPTLYGYDIENLKIIAMILEKENIPPEKVTEVLTDIWRIVALIIRDEFEKTLRNMREVKE